MLDARFTRSYRSKNGNVTFVYTVNGSEQILEQYAEAQGEYFREDDNGNALFFTTKYFGERATLIITSKGKVVPDMSEIDKLASMVQQQGGDFGTAIANVAAQALLGKQAPPPPTPEEPAE